ncbi:hypothetical protein Y032_0270g853 [Ancylostoma ceylanicum]|uniref:Uncharacterized protein n=1 Tax=Ancylostoma ceylanicum TaxID=53326 RepID=A0A016S8J6_9BILA|nr:hypothetical protein Y032_0270g853 [Ancylostoma ceylanicum]
MIKVRRRPKWGSRVRRYDKGAPASKSVQTPANGSTDGEEIASKPGRNFFQNPAILKFGRFFRLCLLATVRPMRIDCRRRPPSSTCRRSPSPTSAAAVVGDGDAWCYTPRGV